jgi:putative DNA primase/helicase
MSGSATVHHLAGPRRAGAPAPAPEAVDYDEVHTGQLRIAERFARRFTGELIYVHRIGWHIWCGTHWIADDKGLSKLRVKELTAEIWAEIGRMDTGPDRKELMADVKKCESSAGMTGVLEIAKSLPPLATSLTQTNADPHLFNARNGTLDLRNGTLRPHDPADLITKVAGADLDPAARSDRWDTFLEEVLPDEEVRGFLQRVFGQAMLGSVEEHVLPIMCGAGRNGKGVAYEAVLRAFGDYGRVVDPKIIMQNKNTLHGTFYADLFGMRLVVTSETNEGGKLDAAVVKRLTGGDRISANRMHENSFEFTPSHSIVLITNHRPSTDAGDSALWARLRVVPFDVVVKRIDTKLPDKIREELDAVLAWVFQGWLDYQEQGLAAPDAVIERTEEYRNEGDSLGEFLTEECVKGQFARVLCIDLYRAWQAWSMHNGVPAMAKVAFGRLMTVRGFERGKSGGNAVYIGLGLRAEEETTGQSMFGG